MKTDSERVTPPARGRRFDWLHILLLVLVTVMVTAGITVWLVKTYVFPSEFVPVSLSPGEERALNDKLERFESLQVERYRRQVQAQAPAASGGRGATASLPTGPLEPEPYSEEGATREIALSERELNALLARNTDLASRLAIDLAGDLVSVKLLVPMDEDFPVLGGRVVKLRAGVALAYRAGRPVVVVKGVSVMGVPLPNAWLGGIKHLDLVQEYGGDPGFWKAFADGVEDLRIEEGRLVLVLKE